MIPNLARRNYATSAVLIPAHEGGYIATNPETGTTTQGGTIEEALANSREATELYLGEFPLKVSGCAILTTFQVAKHAQFASCFWC